VSLCINTLEHKWVLEQGCCLAYLSLSVSPVGELWKNGLLHLDAVLSGVGRVMGVLDWGGDC